MCQIPGQEKWIMFGITSWAFQCGIRPDGPSVYVRVVNYLDWIQNILNQEG